MENGEFWEAFQHFFREGFLLAVSTPGEERWVDPETISKEVESPFPVGHSFAIVDI